MLAVTEEWTGRACENPLQRLVSSVRGGLVSHSCWTAMLQGELGECSWVHGAWCVLWRPWGFIGREDLLWLLEYEQKRPVSLRGGSICEAVPASPPPLSSAAPGATKRYLCPPAGCARCEGWQGNLSLCLSSSLSPPISFSLCLLCHWDTEDFVTAALRFWYLLIQSANGVFKKSLCLFCFLSYVLLLE